MAEARLLVDLEEVRVAHPLEALVVAPEAEAARVVVGKDKVVYLYAFYLFYDAKIFTTLFY